MRTHATARPLKGFPAAYRRLSPLQKLQWLRSPECNELVAYGRLQANQVEAAERSLARNDRRIASIVPGPACLDQYRDGFPFPPPAENTPMRTAIQMLNPTERIMISGVTFIGELNTLWPVITLTRHGATYDVVAEWIASTEHRMDLRASHSPSSYALQRMQELGLTLIPTPLEPEDENHLRLEIANYQKAHSDTARAKNVPLAPS